MRAILATIGLLRRPAPSDVISREEFLRSAAAAAARRFDAIDIHRAGVISRADIHHWLQANRTDINIS
jgi:hypothetical protein